ncbi:MAG TPA: FecR domain-containing protein [Terriglobia bacterium]|nr:FecR domain-containing protein [Terriglobia bacterium]
MRYDRLRRVLVVVVAGLLFLPAALFSQQQNPSPVRSVRLSSVSGTVTVKQPGATEGVAAQLNTPIDEGSEVSASDAGFAMVKLENGSTIELDGLAKAHFTQISTDANGNKVNVITLEQGHAEFHFIPERQDVYKVKIADATLSPQGKAEFQTDFTEGKMQVRVLAGSVIASAHSGSLTLGKGRFMEYHPSMEAEVAKSHARVVRLSYVSGTVMLKRPGSKEEVPAMLNMPIQEGFQLSTSSGSYAEVEFENGSTARLGEFSKLLFHQLALDANGNKLNGITFEQGYATFHFMPEHNSPLQHEGNGAIEFLPDDHDVYHVKIADATLTADGKCRFRTDLEQERFRVEVFSGSVNVSTPTLSSTLGEGKVLERESGSALMAFNIQRGIVKDAWDQWTEARDKQVLLTEKDEAVHPNGPRYGWSDLDTYGEWVTLPGSRFGWSPYAGAGWSPYTYGQWAWYPGFGWTWISGNPWGWVTDHCGLWDFDDSFGWYWMNPMFGCGLWEASLVNWYMGPGWIGWAPMGPGHPKPVPPGGGPPRPPRPGPPLRPTLATREIVTVPTAVVQNRQMITPQMVDRVAPTAGMMIERPPFEPSPRPLSAAVTPALAAGATVTTKTEGAAPKPAAVRVGGSGRGFASRHSSAPSTILMGGDVAKERSLLAHHGFHFGHQPLRAAEGTTLGGRYAVYSSPGEFRGNAFTGGGKNGGASGLSGRSGGIITSHSSGGGSGAVITSHGSSGGASGGGGSSVSGGGGGHSGGGGGSAGGGSSGGGGGHH